MKPETSNVMPIGHDYVRRLEQTLRAAANGMSPGVIMPASLEVRFERIYRIGDAVAKVVPQLCMLAGGACFLARVYTDPLMAIGCVLLMVGTLLSLVDALQ